MTTTCLHPAPDPAALAELLGTRLRVEPAPSSTLRVTYLDTFDWRLHRAGARLAREREGRRRRWVWTPPGGGPPRTVPSTSRARFARDLPPGWLKDALAPLVGPRALLEVGEVEVERQLLRVVDADGNTTLRLWWERVAPLDPDGRRVGPPRRPRVRLDPLPDHDRTLATALELLTAAGMVEPAPADDLMLAAARPRAAARRLQLQTEAGPRARRAGRGGPALDARGGCRRPAPTSTGSGPTTTPSSCTTCGWPCGGPAPRRPARRRRSPTRRSSRWSPSCAGWATPPGPAATSTCSHASWTRPGRPPPRTVTCGPPRSAPGGSGAESAPRPIASWWATFARTAVPACSSAGPRSPGRGAGPLRAGPIRPLADERIRRAYRGVLKRGRRLGASAAPQDLHRLRIAAKRLRYLLELFHSLYPDEVLQAVVRDLRQLQDLLGGVQDTVVQLHRLEALAERFLAGGTAPVSTLLAMGRLTERIVNRQGRLRADFAERFASFAGQSTRDELERAPRRLGRGVAMRVIALWTIKGGVGKTTAAVQPRPLAASRGLRTLLWDLDPQGAASFALRVRARVKGGARALVRQGRGARSRSCG